MDFNLSEEQQLFRDTIDRLVDKSYGFEQRHRHSAEADGWSREVWAQLADQGFLALPFAEADGGLGYGALETGLVMQALGRGLMLEPYLATVVLAGAVLRAGGSGAQRAEWVPMIASGERTLALASVEPQSRHRLCSVATTATRNGEGYRLNGSKIAVLHGHSADALVVSARCAGDQEDEQGIALFLIDADTAGLNRRAYRTQDGLRAADLMLDEVQVPADRLIGEAGQGFALLERAVQEGIVAVASEAVGCMSALLDLTVDYLKQRKQFGGPIGRFQALQHQAVDMLVELELGRSMAMLAALALDDADADARRRTLMAVKVQIGRSSRLVGQIAVQLHGGIGVTEEYAVGHYFRRLTMIESLFGDADHHLDRLATLGGVPH